MVRRHRPKAVSLVPTALRMVLDAQVDPDDLRSILVVTSGSAHLPIEVQEAFEKRYGIAVLPSYGATEFAGGVAGWNLPLHREWGGPSAAASVARSRGREMRIVDPERGRTRATGTPGRSRSAVGRRVGSDHRRRTDRRRRVRVVEGRSDDAIVRGGFKVFPNEIADVLRTHPAVLDAGVTGIADERLGAVPVAAVELREGATIDWRTNSSCSCASASPATRCPTTLLVVDRAPPHAVTEGESARPAGTVRCGDRGVSHPLRGAAAIVGVADEVSPTGEIDLPLRTLEARVVRAALADAGIEPSEVDGLCTCTGGTLMHSVELAEQLGITPDSTDATQIGGASLRAVRRACRRAIAAGLCETVVIVYASTPRAVAKARRHGHGGARHTRAARVGDAVRDASCRSARTRLAANRHMAQYGTTARAARPDRRRHPRRWAAMNPRAHLRDPITVDDVLGSGFVAEPMHKLEYCLVTDGAGAIVVTSAERARDLRQATGLRARRWQPPHPLHDQSDARPHLTPGVRSGRARVRA